MYNINSDDEEEIVLEEAESKAPTTSFLEDTSDEEEFEIDQESAEVALQNLAENFSENMLITLDNGGDFDPVKLKGPEKPAMQSIEQAMNTTMRQLKAFLRIAAREKYEKEKAEKKREEAELKAQQDKEAAEMAEYETEDHVSEEEPIDEDLGDEDDTIISANDDCTADEMGTVEPATSNLVAEDAIPGAESFAAFMAGGAEANQNSSEVILHEKKYEEDTKTNNEDIIQNETQEKLVEIVTSNERSVQINEPESDFGQLFFAHKILYSSKHN